MPDSYDTDHKFPNASVEWYEKISDLPHNMNGHTGHRCIECARESENPISTESDSGDYWQNKQLAWQEECDVIMAKFDREVAIHFPAHMPMNCTTCPMTGTLPPKPNPPIERHRYA